MKLWKRKPKPAQNITIVVTRRDPDPAMVTAEQIIKILRNYRRHHGGQDPLG